ncbi:hypothetical protein GCM10011581_38660 [Saccharopolyspora subtropica]|uniref:IclR family transcriptional regulator n=1 Tax=Saccharopolyspora thermophila TaxID=89367 RepID=A0A917K3L5_9PSEU|nr:IclR family transcriptional regulator [Saccharopolyspora subtropica]GGI97774.1 hypothetical protein GCM10011581_38660 [Saccharopolyspora subtropica]
MSASPNAAQPAQLLGKVAAVLEVLAAREQATTAELATAVDEPRSSIHRLMQGLDRLGWVESGEGRGQWRLGLQLFRLGSNAVRHFDERRLALPHMRELRAATSQTVYLCIRRGLDAVCIERLDGEWVQSLALQLGGSLPLHRGAAPRVLLAHSSAETVEAACRQAAADQDEQRAPEIAAALREQLEQIRAAGYAISDEDVTPGIAAVGAPIFDYSGEIRAALSVSGIRNSILGPQAGIVDLVVETAAKISHHMGHAQPPAPSAT